MIMCVLLCYPVSFHILQLLLTGRPISSSCAICINISFLKVSRTSIDGDCTNSLALAILSTVDCNELSNQMNFQNVNWLDQMVGTKTSPQFSCYGHRASTVAVTGRF